MCLQCRFFRNFQNIYIWTLILCWLDTMLALKIQFTQFFFVFLFAYFLILWSILKVLSVSLSILLGYTRWDPDHVKKTKARLCHQPLLLTHSQHHFIRHFPNSQHDAPVCTFISFWTMWGVPAAIWVDLRKGQGNRPVVCDDWPHLHLKEQA